MENEHKTFEFLSTDSSQKYFAESDFALRQGRHIQNFGSDGKLFDYIDGYFDEGLAEYYRLLFGVVLKRELNTYTNEKYYFLDFNEEDKGKFGQNRSKELDLWQLIFGLLLINFFYEKYFESSQTVTKEELDKVIYEGPNNIFWKKHLFGEYKENYTPKERLEADAKILKTIREFERMGWVNRSDKKEFDFDVLPAIDRLVKMYKSEIENIDKIFSE
jgi:hypothetical protein